MNSQYVYGLTDASLPVAYLHLMIEILKEHNVNTDLLISQALIDPNLLDATDGRITPLQWASFVLAAMTETGNSGLGYEQGIRMKGSTHGIMGYAAMSSNTLEDAMDLAIKFILSRQRSFTLTSRKTDSHYDLLIRERHSIPLMRTFFYETMLIGITSTACSLLGLNINALNDVEIHVDWPEPDYHKKYKNRLPKVVFSQAENLIKIPLHYGKTKLPFADSYSAKQLSALCEHELSMLGGPIENFPETVSEMLKLEPYHGYPDTEEIAAKLHISDRTLKRRLEQGGTSFRSLLDKVRERDAKHLLAQRNLSVNTVANHMGYLNPANFTRAFKKWTGYSPSSYRKKWIAQIIK